MLANKRTSVRINTHSQVSRLAKPGEPTGVVEASIRTEKLAGCLASRPAGSLVGQAASATRRAAARPTKLPWPIHQSGGHACLWSLSFPPGHRRAHWLRLGRATGQPSASCRPDGTCRGRLFCERARELVALGTNGELTAMSGVSFT